MNRWIRSAAALLMGIALLSVPNISFAESKADIKRLKTSRDSERYKKAVPGHSIRAGGGRILVNAPLAQVRKVVMDFGAYQNFMPRFKKSRVLSKNKKFTDVYLQVPILHGAAKVWSLTRFRAPKKLANGTEIIEGRMLQGNVRDFRAKWYLIPVGKGRTLLKAEILIVPKLPVPGSMVTGELQYAADQAVTASRNRAEAGKKKVSRR